MEEPGRLQSMGSLRVGHDWATSFPFFLSFHLNILSILPPSEKYWGFPDGSVGKESTCNVGELGSVPGLGRSLEKGTVTHSSILAWRVPGTV